MKQWSLLAHYLQRTNGFKANSSLLLHRYFHASVKLKIRETKICMINPFFPFEVSEESDANEYEKENKKLKHQNAALLKAKKENAREKIFDEQNDLNYNDTGSSDGIGKHRIYNETQEKVGNSKNKADICNQFDTGKVIICPEADASSGNNRCTVQTHHDNCRKTGASGPDSSSRRLNIGQKKSKKEDMDRADEYEHSDDSKLKSQFKETFAKLGKLLFKSFETAVITFCSLLILAFAGILYHRFYNENVIDKINEAFETGDPASRLAVHKRTNKHRAYEECNGEDLSKYWVERPQQKMIDDIISGKITGRYFLLIGEKGTGKTSLLLEAMKKVNGYNVAIFDAHADPEIFRLRLGKALNFSYSEDYIGSLFNIRGPRDTTALLDIERAFQKLEELAIKRIGKTKNKPMVLIVNNAHLIKDNEEGIHLIELLQQKAENLSGSELVTMVFNSDDYWVYENLKKLGTRLELINVRDFSKLESQNALRFIREKYFPSSIYPNLRLSDAICAQIYDLIGGRPQHISQVARHENIIKACHEIIDREKTWFLNQCGLLGKGMDDDVMESGKFSTSTMLLAREFVMMVNENLKRNESFSSQPEKENQCENEEHNLPELPLWRARQIMTRSDYIQLCDHLNIFTIDSESRVRADSVPMMRAFQEIVAEPDFETLLQETIERVADIESLGRTREITLKDLAYGSNYLISEVSNKELTSSKDENLDNAVNCTTKSAATSISLVKSPMQVSKEGETATQPENSENLYMEEIDRQKMGKRWKHRMSNLISSTK